MHRTAIIALVGVALAGAAGCGSEPRSEAAGRVAVEAAAVQAPGAPLGNGLEVQEGTRLVGTVFPVEAQDGDGWRAVLVVDGDGVDVWNRYAGELGIANVASSDDACVGLVVGTGETVGYPSVAERLMSERRLDGENQLACDADVGGTSMHMRVGLQRSCDDEPCVLLPVAHLSLEQVAGRDDWGVWVRSEEVRYEREQYADDEHEYEYEDESSDTTRAPEPEGEVRESFLPVAGERFDAGLDYFLGDTHVVPAGMRSVVAPAMLLACNSGLVTVLATDLPGADAVAAFGELQQPGGFDIDVDSAVGSDGTTYLLVAECGD